MCGFISGLSTLFHGFMCLFLCQYHTVLSNIALSCSLKLQHIMPLALFSLKVALAIWGLLWFHKIFQIVCSISVKNAIGILIKIALNL